MKKLIKEIEEKYKQLNKEEKQEFQKGYKSENLEEVKSPLVFELLQGILEEENKIKRGIKMVEKIKKEEESGVLTGEIVNKDLAIAKKKDNLLVKQEMSITEWKEVVEALYKSGYFKDLQNISQAIAKAQAGKELGFLPFYSLNNFFILPGKPPASSGQVMAALIKRSGYDYRTVKHDNDICTLKFFGLKGEEIGIASFTFKEADSVVMKTQYGDKKLTAKDNWRNYRYDMLFWRAMARGAREFCPDAIAGLYLKDEIDFEGNEEAKGDSDLSAFKVETPQLKAGSEIKTEKTRKDILEDLVKQFGNDRIKEVKTKLKFTEKLLEISDEDFKKFVIKLNEKEHKKEEKNENKKDETKKHEEKKELTREERKEILENLKKKYGSKLKEIKEEMKIDGKVIDLKESEFLKYIKEFEKED